MITENQKAINKAINKASVKSFSLNREIRATEKSIKARRSSSKLHREALNQRIVENLKSPVTLAIITSVGLCWAYFKFSKKPKNSESVDKDESISKKENISEKENNDQDDAIAKRERQESFGKEEVKPLSWISTVMNLITIAEVVCAFIPAKKPDSIDGDNVDEIASEEIATDSNTQ